MHWPVSLSLIWRMEYFLESDCCCCCARRCRWTIVRSIGCWNLLLLTSQSERWMYLGWWGVRRQEGIVFRPPLLSVDTSHNDSHNANEVSVYLISRDKFCWDIRLTNNRLIWRLGDSVSSRDHEANDAACVLLRSETCCWFIFPVFPRESNIHSLLVYWCYLLTICLLDFPWGTYIKEQPLDDLFISWTIQTLKG